MRILGKPTLEDLLNIKLMMMDAGMQPNADGFYPIALNMVAFQSLKRCPVFEIIMRGREDEYPVQVLGLEISQV